MADQPTTLGTRGDDHPSHLDMRHGPVSKQLEAELTEEQFRILLDHINAIVHPFRERLAAVVDTVEKMAADVAATHTAVVAQAVAAGDVPPQPVEPEPKAGESKSSAAPPPTKAKGNKTK